MAPYEEPWRNTWGPYTQVARIDEIDNWKLKRLLLQYGECFDDDWWYYVTTKGKGKGIFVKRAPIWQTNKRIDMEKWKARKDVQQVSLIEILEKVK